MPFIKNLYHIETRRLICIANQVTGFYMILVLTERYCRTDYSNNLDGFSRQCRSSEVVISELHENGCILFQIYPSKLPEREKRGFIHYEHTSKCGNGKLWKMIHY